MQSWSTSEPKFMKHIPIIMQKQQNLELQNLTAGQCEQKPAQYLIAGNF